MNLKEMGKFKKHDNFNFLRFKVEGYRCHFGICILRPFYFSLRLAVGLYLLLMCYAVVKPLLDDYRSITIRDLEL